MCFHFYSTSLWDLLPAQASSVPSECIFSSSKEACTIRRSNLFNLTEDLVVDERDYTISGPVTPRAVDELMTTWNLREFDELLQNARDIDFWCICWSMY
ncbi:hypothetical protein C8R48DRAFT_622849 [Suillus tomentosus]|jgi:hypothetical protein|nr:hypothetical protein C8R48DRAFT_622849 [Suillus tomentosus]